MTVQDCDGDAAAAAGGLAEGAADSYRALPPEAARLYRLLGLHPGPDFGVGVAAAAAELPPAEAAGLLERLAGGHLVERAGPDRYRLPDAARADARARVPRECGPAEPAAAVHRMARWYLETAAAADMVLMPDRWRLGPVYDRLRSRAGAADGSPEAALGVLEAERANLRAIVRAAEEYGFDELVWQLCEALWGLYFRHGHHDDWLDTHRRGVAAAERCADLRAEGRMRCQLGFALLALERWEEAEEQFTGAERADGSAGHRRGEATALEFLGLLRMRQSRWADALMVLEQARELAAELGDPRALALLEHHIGRALGGEGRYADAERQLTRARELMARLPDPYNEARVMTSLAEVLLAEGRATEAAGVLATVAEVMEREQAAGQSAAVAELRSRVAERLGDRDGALRHARRALDGYRTLGTPRAERLRERVRELEG
ncbi:tetratricopeptide repeat protein [Allostreptomyces psammosilenae]|uniref:Tetratricopeptide (TPR) repeat protein n=1 Tax=Allostreptomyces psammosilenae TaxID=1892865 RepID=A0A852ZZL5_9ACTN|nr:tetratricopeptide repeat protein [Allostreptomyces psammosilenae]NYI07813.1 tetratricopeptide (TPR) repeat protein [Allostreptomyces psammosilenae]